MSSTGDEAPGLLQTESETRSKPQKSRLTRLEASTLGVPNLLTSLGHSGGIALGHTKNTLTLTIADEIKKKKKNLSIIFVMFQESIQICDGQDSKLSWATCGP